MHFLSNQFAIGFSAQSDTSAAIDEAAQQALSKIEGQKVDLVFLLTTIEHPPLETLNAINKIFVNTKIIGSSCAGIILSDSVQIRGIAIFILKSDEIKVGISSVENLDVLETRQAGSMLAQNCLKDFGTHHRGLFTFLVDSHLKDNSTFLRGIQEILGNASATIGAGSSDDFKFEKNYQFFQNFAYKSGAVGLMLGGNIKVGIGSCHGWLPLGKPRYVTLSEKNVIQTIDNQPASIFYQEYFDKESTGPDKEKLSRLKILYPLGIHVEHNNEYLIRNVLEITPDGKIICQGDIPQGTRIHLMIGSKEHCQKAAFEAAQEAKKNLSTEKASFLIVFESMARLKLLGRTAFKEILEIKKVFGKDIPIFGMYSHGEFCPFQSTETSKNSYFQNENIVIIAIA